MGNVVYIMYASGLVSLWNQYVLAGGPAGGTGSGGPEGVGVELGVRLAVAMTVGVALARTVGVRLCVEVGGVVAVGVGAPGAGVSVGSQKLPGAITG